MSHPDIPILIFTGQMAICVADWLIYDCLRRRRAFWLHAFSPADTMPVCADGTLSFSQTAAIYLCDYMDLVLKFTNSRKIRNFKRI